MGVRQAGQRPECPVCFRCRSACRSCATHAAQKACPHGTSAWGHRARGEGGGAIN